MPFATGIETKIDENQQPLGTFRRLENVVFDIPGKVQKRNGYEALTLETIEGSDLQSPEELLTFQEELNSVSQNKLYSFISALNKWDEKGNLFSANPLNEQVLRNNVAQSNLDAVHANGLDVFVYQDSTGIGLTIIDTENDNFVVSNQNLSATGTVPKVVNRGGFIYVFYIDGTDIKFRKFSVFQFNDIEAETTAINTLDATNKVYDVTVIDDQIVIAFNNNTAGGTLGLLRIGVDDGIGSIVEVSGETCSNGVHVSGDSASRIVTTYADSSDAKIVVFNISLGVVILSATSLESIGNISNITACETSTAGSYEVFYEIDQTNDYDHYIKKNTINLAATVGTPEVMLRSVGLASKCFMYDDEIYLQVLHKNTLQSTYFIAKSDGVLVTKLLNNTGGDLIGSKTLPRVSSVGANRFLLTNQIKGRLEEDNGTFFSILGVNRTVLNFAPASKFENAEMANNLHIAGGFLKMYDGKEVVEHGFHLFPEGLEDGGTSTTGGSLEDGVYQYAAVYSWTDAKGNEHRSAPSIGFEVTLNGATSTQQQTITVPTLRLTDKSDVIIELYRTEANGTIFYKVTDTENPVQNDPTVDSVSIVDTTSDTDLLNNQLLYTTGGVLDNIAAPAATLVESFQNRLFVANPKVNRLNYSKIRFEGQPVEFNDSLQLPISDVGGDITALKAMDDKIIIFKESAMYYLSGDGPNNIGEQDTFIEPELISSEIGCINEDSVILAPTGIFFRSQRGIYRLSQSLQLDYVGSSVEEYNNLTITSAVLVADTNQIRFTTRDGDCLVYNFFQQKWCTFTNHKGLSAVDILNQYYYLRPDGSIYKENALIYTDNGTAIKTVIETGWLSFSGIQSFQRVYRMLILGTYRAPHKIRVQAAYNFVDAFIEEKTIDSSDFIDYTAYGNSSPYGSEATYGAKNSYQIRFDFKKQKCETIKVRIEDILDTPGLSMDISNLLFVVGAKVGEFKTDQSKAYGAE